MQYKLCSDNIIYWSCVRSDFSLKIDEESDVELWVGVFLCDILFFNIIIKYIYLKLIKAEGGEKEYVHMLNGTLCAT